MKKRDVAIHSVLAAFLAFAITGCSEQTSNQSATRQNSGADTGVGAFAPPSELKGELVNGHVELAWKHNATEACGYWIEFTTPGDDFVKIAATWPDTTAFRHPNVAPGSTFVYCIRPFFGRPSEISVVNTAEPIEITSPPPVKGEFLGTPSPNVEGPLEDLPPVEGVATPKHSLKSIATIADAVPTSLTAKLSSATGADLRWQDNAADEDGYLVEISSDRESFNISALLPPNATSFRKTGLPPNAKSYFRVRAFFYGAPSETASVFTGPASALPTRVSTASENAQ